MRPTAEPPVVRGAADGTQSIKRAFAVLRVVAATGEAGASLREVATATGLHRATAHRILRALSDERMVECPAGRGPYRLGIEIAALGVAMGDRFDLKSLAGPAVDRLCAMTQDIVYLVVRSGYDGLCVTMREGTYPEKALRLMEGDRWPLGVGTNNLAILAWLPDAEIAEIVTHNEVRLAGVDESTTERILSEVDETRRCGYAVRTRGDYPPMCGVGVPVLDRAGRPFASLGIIAVKPRMTADRQAKIAEQLWLESKALSQLWQRAPSIALASYPSRDHAAPARAIAVGH